MERSCFSAAGGYRVEAPTPPPPPIEKITTVVYQLGTFLLDIKHIIFVGGCFQATPGRPQSPFLRNRRTLDSLCSRRIAPLNRNSTAPMAHGPTFAAACGGQTLGALRWRFGPGSTAKP